MDWNKFTRIGLIGLIYGGLSSCQVPEIPEEYLPILHGEVNPPPPPVYERVGRQEAIQMARRYARHAWQPTEKNAWHGYDPDGIRVDTPDVSFKQRGMRPGWWEIGQVNQGVPFQWGGFSSLAEFDAGLARGLAAGDVLSAEKQEMLRAGEPTVSRAAVGIGASGLVSRCWKLEKNHTTRELVELSTVLEDYEDLLPGDILNLPGVHVILVEQFADKRHRAVLGYEAGAPPSWKVVYNHLPVSHLKRMGYKPMRYNHIESAPDDAKALGLRSAEPEVPVPLPGVIVPEDPDAPFL